MRVAKSIKENLRFLTIEVGEQLGDLETYFQTGSSVKALRILDRSGYAYNLKMRVHDGCVEALRGGEKTDDTDARALRAAESMATGLARLAELAQACVREAASGQDFAGAKRRAHASMVGRVGRGADLIERLSDSGATAIALEICRIEPKLSRDHAKLTTKIKKGMKGRKKTDQALADLFLAQRLKEMGEALLTIGEAVISANMGQPLSMDRYHSLWSAIEPLNEDGDEKLTVQPLAVTRSGSGISGVARKKSKAGKYLAVFKDGTKDKVKEEREKVEEWHQIYPGIAPKILSYSKEGERAALLIEHLQGQTFEDILLTEPIEQVELTLKHLKKTLKDIWNETRIKRPSHARHMSQLRKRLDQVFSVHPGFDDEGAQINGVRVGSYRDLLDQAAKLEERFPAPFSVYIHGDFNLDNVLFHAAQKDIRFIDLHRSRYMDYVQDMAVFMVSSYRLQALDAPLRRRVQAVDVDMYRFAKEFAKEQGDKTFDTRLAFGLARSFASSTRFILDRRHAEAMFMRSRYLLERLTESGEKGARHYVPPIEELFLG